MIRIILMLTAITTMTMITMIAVTTESLAHMQRNALALTHPLEHRAAANRAAFRGTIAVRAAFGKSTPRIPSF